MVSNDSKPAYDPAPAIDYDYLFKPGWFERLLYHSSGTDLQLLRHCPNYDRVKLQGIGGTVLATALLAFISGSYAFYTVFAPSAVSDPSLYSYRWMLASLVFGLVWAMVIYNLDRFIVATTGHGDGSENVRRFEVYRALPRILMACFIGFVIAKPLEIRIMKHEIETVLDQRRQSKLDELRGNEQKVRDQKIAEAVNAKADLAKQRAAKLDELNKFEQLRNKAESDFKDEVDGKARSGQEGLGPKGKEKQRLMEERRLELEQAKARLLPEAKELEDRIRAQEQLVANANAEFNDNDPYRQRQAARVDGLIERIEIAHERSFWATWFLTLMLIFIEVAPLFFKMMLSLSPIDYITENQKRLSEARRGIWLQTKLSGGGYLEAPVAGIQYERDNIMSVDRARYYEAELEEAKVLGKLKIDRELTQEVHASFKTEVLGDIKANPSAYVQRLKPEKPEGV